jgi:hypothetical protein
LDYLAENSPKPLSGKRKKTFLHASVPFPFLSDDVPEATSPDPISKIIH